MDTYANIKTQNPKRIVNIFCAVEQHGNCAAEEPGACGCQCHYAVTIAGGTTLANFAYNLWRISSVLAALDEGERQARLEALIDAADDTVDFEGVEKYELIHRLRPTLSRAYWSHRETADELGVLPGWKR